MQKKVEMLRVIVKRDKDNTVDVACYNNATIDELLDIYSKLIANIINSCADKYQDAIIIDLEKRIKELLTYAK